MTSEDDLIAKLDSWLAEQPTTPTLFDVLATGDRELAAAFLLKAFRAAAKQAVVDNLEREAAGAPPEPGLEAASAAMRLFDGMSRAWALTEHEQLILLAVETPAALAVLRRASPVDLSAEVVDRLAILLDIFRSINTLLPIPERADAWMRSRNAAPLFGGRSALEFMLQHGLHGLRRARDYLRSELAGS